MKRNFVKALVMLTVLGIAMPSTVSGVGFSSAETRNINMMSISSEKYLLAAVENSSFPNPQSSLTLAATTTGVIFYVKNFGTRSISTFEIGQQSIGAVNLRYCESGFGSNFVTNICNDGTASILVAIHNGNFSVSLSTSLAPGSSIDFKQDSRRTTQNVISISVSPQ